MDFVDQQATEFPGGLHAFHSFITLHMYTVGVE
jgi:hypothetical protein